MNMKGEGKSSGGACKIDKATSSSKNATKYYIKCKIFFYILFYKAFRFNMLTKFSIELTY